jgi:excinuclease ABC subunit A
MGKGIVGVDVIGGEEMTFLDPLRLHGLQHLARRDRPAHLLVHSPYGACPTCHGLGTQTEFDPERHDPRQELESGEGQSSTSSSSPARKSCRTTGPRCSRRWRSGSGSRWRRRSATCPRTVRRPGPRHQGQRFDGVPQPLGPHPPLSTPEYPGVLTILQRQYAETTSQGVKEDLEQYMSSKPCPDCRGKRLKPRRSR